MKIYYLSTRDRDEDYLRTADYLFRYDRGVTNVRPKSLLGRLVLGKWMTSTRWLELAEKVPWLLRDRHPTVTVDVFVPASRVPEFLTWYEREIGSYPLWCVPYRRVRDYPWLTACSTTSRSTACASRATATTTACSSKSSRSSAESRR
ncbi:MAG TPA: hypothetical protein VFQ65_19730 [Kofleriaceae bacterium]|nr:hypothetical protein [Kofleriaceae bacterium]